jgi:hypothetical protein
MDDRDFTSANEIDAKGERIFTNAMPVEWKRLVPHPDFRVDFQYEIRDAGTLTGMTFLVQLKSQSRVVLNDRGARFSGLECKHIRYWMKCQRPVFLVLVDVETKEGFWVFIQQYVADNLSKSDWNGTQKTITVYLPVTQALQKHDLLKASVYQASDYMIGLQPGALDAALSGSKAALERLDSRFNVEITARSTGAICREIRAKEPVKFQLNFKGPAQRAHKFREECIGKGIPFSFDAGEIEVVGSDLVAEAVRTSSVIHTSIERQIHVRLHAFDSQGSLVGPVDLDQAVMSGGVDEARVSAALCDVISFTGIISRAKPPQGFLRLNPLRWAGSKLLDLNAFESISAVVIVARAGGKLFVQAAATGRQLFAGHLDELDRDESWTTAVAVLAMLRHARVVARRLGVNPVVPAILTQDDFDVVEGLYDLTTFGPRPAQDAVVTTVWDLKELEAAVRAAPDRLEEGDLRLTRLKEDAMMFGEKVEVPALMLSFSRVKPAIPSGDLAQLFATSPDPITIQWVPMPGATVNIELAAPDR